MLQGTAKRVDLMVAPGDLLYRRSGRTFEAEPAVREFVHTALVHDADGDGHADELVIARGGCIHLPLEGQYSQDAESFCKVRPRGTNAIYKYCAGTSTGGNGEQMVGACRISPDTDPEAPLLVSFPKGVDAPEYIEGSFASGMASGDWDGDGKADLAIAMPDRVDFYLSAGRSAGHLPGVGAPTHSVNLDVPDLRRRENWQRPRNAEVGEVDELAMAYAEDDTDFDTALHYMVAKDFDLDGEVELVVAESTGLLVLKFDGQEWRTAREEYLSGTDASYGLGAADLNNDGVADVLASSAHGMHVLFAKPPETARRFLAVTLQGTQANAYGIGATVVLWASNMGPCRQVRSQLREVQTHGYGVHEDGASSDDRLVFGLGEHGVPLNLTVRWPGPTWAEQVVSGAELSEAVGSTAGGWGLEQMRRPLVVTEPS